jgi:glycosyltransferase involved in cell wall biosynthesis
MAKSNGLLFLTHVGDPGGAEFKMLDLCNTVGDSAEVMLFQHGSLERILRERGIRYCVCPMGRAASVVRRESGLLGMVKAIPATLLLLGKLCRKARRFEAVVCMSQKSFVLASLGKVFIRRPILWFMNDILSTDHFSAMAIRVIVWLSRYSADHIVLNSKASLEYWLASGGRNTRLSVIYPVTLDDEKAAHAPDAMQVSFCRRKYSPDGKPLIGMFGRISRWKGQEVFLRAMAEIPNVNAVIAGGAHFGEQEYDRHLRALARELGVEGRVVFAGHVDNALALMACCDVVTHCSTSPEPFGQVILQSMLVGTPVIATDAGGAREIVIHDETGQLTPMKDHHALAVAIRRCLADPQWSRQLARQARELAQRKFSAAVMASRFTRILETL